MAYFCLRISTGRSARIQSCSIGHRVVVKRALSTASTTSVRTSDAVDRLPANLRVRNMLENASRLFSPDSPLAAPGWQRRTESAAERLAAAADHLDASRPLRIGIVGESRSGVSELVNLLLDDPMAQYGQEETTGQLLKALQARQAHSADASKTTTRIRYNETAIVTPNDAQVPFAWLRQNNVELFEVIDPTSVESALDVLYTFDKLLFVTDDFTLAAHARFGRDLRSGIVFRLLQRFSQKPGTQVIVNHGAQRIVDVETVRKGLQAATQSESSSLEAGSNAVILTSFSLAYEANNALRQALASASPTAPPASVWDTFSTLFARSGLDVVRSAFERPSNTSEGHLSAKDEEVALRASVFVLRRALEQAFVALERDLEHAAHAGKAAESLLDDVKAERETFLRAVFDSTPNENASSLHVRAGDRSRSVDVASMDAWNVVETTFSTRLPWWKVLWRTDDVRAETEAAIARGFAKQLEQRLMVQTGRLVSVAERLQRRVRALFVRLDDKSDDATSTRSPFASPLLLNELRKYPLEKVEAELKADLLVEPIVRRKDQLVSSGGPVDMLCDRAQTNALTTVGIVGPTSLLTLCGGLCGSSLFGSAMPSALQVIAMQPSTAVATFAFVTLATLWSAQSRWTRAKRRFWRDWERIADGLDADLHRNTIEAFDNTVAKQSIVAAHALQTKAATYTKDVDVALMRLEELQSDLQRSNASAAGNV